MRGIARPRVGVSDTAFGWLTISTFSSARRDESSAQHGEPFESARLRCGFEQIQAVVRRSISFSANLSPRLAAATFTLTSGAGPRRPNAARALCKESYMTEAAMAGATRLAKPDIRPK